jgi:phospholipid/cholesterol/gamma-HCH transport system ATP-binding protein
MLTVTDRVGMMYKGDLIFDGTTQEAQESENPYVKQFVHGLTEGPL